MTALLLPHGPGAAGTPPPAGPRSAPRRADRGHSWPAAAYRWFARLVLAVALLGFAVLAVGPHVLGYRTMTMLTGSMSPMIDPGDVVIDTPVPVRDITVGMVISYQIPIGDHHVESHRVVSVQRGADGRVTIETKGDANAAVDPWKATLQGDTAYRVRMVVPKVGTAITALRRPTVSRALVYGAPTLLAAWLILAIWRPAPEDEEVRS